MPRFICFVILILIVCLSSGYAGAHDSYGEIENEALTSLMAQIDPEMRKIILEESNPRNPDRPWENTFFEDQMRYSNDAQGQYVSTLVLPVDESVSALNIPKLDKLKVLIIVGHEGLTEIKGLRGLQGLEELTIRRAAISNLGFDNLPLQSLKHLSLLHCAVSSLELSQAAILETIELEEVSNLEKLNIRQCPQLKEIDITKSNPQEITIIDNPKMHEIALVSNRKLKAINLKSCYSLKYFRVAHVDFDEEYYTPLETLNLESLPNLSHIQMNTTELKTLDISQVPSLKHLKIGNNPQISEILLGENSQLSDVSL